MDINEHVEEQNTIDHDEVAISVDDNDEIVAHPSQLMDLCTSTKNQNQWWQH